MPEINAQSKSASLVSRFGTIVLDGYGIQARVQSGHLILEDGIAQDRRSATLPRVNHGLRRLVIIGSEGNISLAALRWLADQKISLTMLERDGSVLATTGPVSPSDARLRRAQALAHHSGAALTISRELIRQKIAGQERVARERLNNSTVADAVARFCNRLDSSIDLDMIRTIESRAAQEYWSAWRALSIKFPTNCLSKIPDHWKTFGTRDSPLTGSPRLAANPVNAMLNYLYAILESESRLALAAVGLDPGLGVLHKDTVRRDSLACDLMEAVRPDVDAFLFDWFANQTLRREWFFEQRDGSCRLMASLAAKLSETAMSWHRLVAPWTEWIAHTLWSTSSTKERAKPRPTRLTQSHRREVKGGVSKAHSAPAPETVCHSCGIPIRRGTKFCRPCSLEVAKNNMIKIAKIGRQRTHSLDAQNQRSLKRRKDSAALRAWEQSGNVSMAITETDYADKIQPLLREISNSLIMSTLDVSLPYAVSIRHGQRRPHPRHWQALAGLVEFAT
jgi:CRISPR-associated protein Cas1